MTDHPSESELVLKAKARDATAFRQLVDRHGPALLRLSGSVVQNRADAEDLAQEALLRAYLKLHTLRDDGLFGPWLRRLAYRTCLDHLKRSQPSLFAGDAETNLPAATEDPHEALEQQELNAQVRDAIKRLPTRYRVPVMLRDLEGLSYKEVAAFLGVPPGTAKSHVFLGRKLLRELLEPFMNEEIEMAEQTKLSSENLFPNFTDLARMALELAAEEGAKRQSEVGVIDLAVGLVELPDQEASLRQRHGIEGKPSRWPGGLAGFLMRQQGISAAMLRATRPAIDGDTHLASLIQAACKTAADMQPTYVGTEHLLLAIVAQEIASDLFLRHGLTPDFVHGEILRHA